MQATSVGQKPLHILHDKPFRADAIKQSDILVQQKIARVIAGLCTGTAESLARWPAQQNVQFTESKTGALQHQLRMQFTDVYRFTRCRRKIVAVGFHRIGVNIGCKTNVITSLLKSKGATTCACEQTDRGCPVKLAVGSVKSVNHNAEILSCLHQRVNG